MDPTKKPAQDAQGEADDSALADDLDPRISRALDAKLNAAMTSRDKRLMGGFEKPPRRSGLRWRGALQRVKRTSAMLRAVLSARVTPLPRSTGPM